MEDRELGYLRACADRRFVGATLRAFERVTKFSTYEHDYWIEMSAGGTAGHGDWATADYAYENGARVMGWQSHGNGCGGFPGARDDEIREAHDRTLEEVGERYPKAQHYSMWARLDESEKPVVDIRKIERDNGLEK